MAKQKIGPPGEGRKAKKLLDKIAQKEERPAKDPGTSRLSAASFVSSNFFFNVPGATTTQDGVQISNSGVSEGDTALDLEVFLTLGES